MSNRHIEMVAESAYESVRAWINNHGGDLPYWKDADEPTREEALRKVEVLMQAPFAGDAKFHNEWSAERRTLGWSEGQEFSETRKIDPMMKPFHQLPTEIRARDKAFRAVVNALGPI